MSSPLVTIALPLYNAETTLSVAVQSILGQTWQNWELLVMDDGSSDSSLTVARSFNDPRIRIVTDGVNRGIGARLNQAVDMARGDYFARMDADDISFPERIEKQVRFMESNPSVDLLATGILYIRNDDSPIGMIPVRTSHGEICRAPWNGFYMPHPTWLGRLDWFRANRYRSKADKAEDQDLLFRTCQFSTFACLDDVLLAYRQERRLVGKMLNARYVFFKALTGEALRQRRLGVAGRVVAIQILKAAADILNICFGVTRLRNTLLSAPPDLLERWEQVRKSVRI
ncbi:MAG: glycosyltransferase family 2 protein [Desulfuromonadales bacterium]|nr:MAG: glycosyltransferase family 2 protein [Desulfuromonadales bacterium]